MVAGRWGGLLHLLRTLLDRVVPQFMLRVHRVFIHRPRCFLYHACPTSSGCGKREVHDNWSMVKLEKPASVTGTDYWPCAGGLSVENAIDVWTLSRKAGETINQSDSA